MLNYQNKHYDESSEGEKMNYKKAILIVVSILITGCASQKSMYYKATDTNTIEAYQKFLEKYPDGEYAANIKSKIEKLEYQMVIESNSIDSLQNFLTKYPSSSYREEIQQKIEKLEFDEAKTINTIQGLQDFLKKYPKTKFKNEANKSIIKLEFEEVEKISTVESYKKFSQKYPNSEFSQKSEQGIKDIEFIEAKQQNTIVAFINFFTKYNDSSYLDKITDSKIKTKVKTQLVLQEITKSDFDKASKAFIDFLKENPEEAKTTFKNNVRDILDSLSRKAKLFSSINDLEKLSYLDTFFSEKNRYENVVISEMLFSIIATSQEKIYNNFKYSGFTNISQNMGAYQSNMKQLNDQKTQLLLRLISFTNKNNSVEVRMRAWKALDYITELLDLPKLKEIDVSMKQLGYYGYKLADLAVDINLKYSELKKLLLDARAQENNSKIQKQTNIVLNKFK